MIAESLAALLLLAGVPPAPAPLDSMVDVGDHRLHLVVHRGTVPVTILMESGGGASLRAWSGVEAELARRSGATVVAYERAGFGGSELGPEELTPAEQVRQIEAALDGLGVPRRRILVGHSYGGLMALLHARDYPADVAGVVLVDPMNPRFLTATGDFVKGTVPRIETPKDDRERAIARMTRTFDGLAGEVAAAEPALRAPMVVITAGTAWWRRPEIDAAWRASHEAIAAAAPNRRLVVAEGSDHDVPEDRPDAIVDAVLSLLTPPAPR